MTPPTVPKPKGSLALTTKPTTVFTSQAFPDSTSSTSAAAKRQSAGSKKRHINPSYFTADGVDIDGGTSNHAPSGNSSSGSRRTVIDLSVDAASTQQDQQAPKRGPGRPSGTSKRTAKATTSAGGGGTKNYTLSDARSSGGVDDSINGGGGVKAGTYSHTKSTNGVEQESMWDLDLDLQLDDIPARPAPHRGGAPAQTIPPAGAQSSQQLWSSHLDLDQQAATNIAVDDRSNSLRHSRAFTEVSSDAHLVPAPSSFAAYSAYGTAAASVSALAPASAPAEPVPPRFLKRKFSGAPLTSLPAWEDDER